jgi:hypothetical protein
MGMTFDEWWESEGETWRKHLMMSPISNIRTIMQSATRSAWEAAKRDTATMKRGSRADITEADIEWAQASMEEEKNDT